MTISLVIGNFFSCHETVFFPRWARGRGGYKLSVEIITFKCQRGIKSNEVHVFIQFELKLAHTSYLSNDSQLDNNFFCVLGTAFLGGGGILTANF